ncbi:MAG: hypothetical protein IBX71_05525 [Candidatus Desulforudis sp.]|nr:hypothetical protein [Desulforudis sp.]
MKDRLTRGFIAGLLAGIVMNGENYLTFYALNFADLRHLDWAAALVFGHPPTNILETAFAQIVQLFFAGLAGILFAYLVPFVTSRNHLLKGWIYGVLVWWVAYALTIMFRLPGLVTITLETAVSNVIGASLYGLVLAALLRWLEQRAEAA